MTAVASTTMHGRTSQIRWSRCGIVRNDGVVPTGRHIGVSLRGRLAEIRDGRVPSSSHKDALVDLGR